MLISEHNQIARRLKLDDFPYTKDEWYKYIFWPVHVNGGDHQYLDERRTQDNPSPYAKLATTMRAPQNPRYRRGTIHTTMINSELRGVHPRTTFELGRTLNRLELRTAPQVRLRLQFAALHCYQHVITPRLQFQYQPSTVPTTAPTSASASFVPVSSLFTNQQQGEPTQDARTALPSVRSWSDRRNSSLTPSLDNTVPSFMRNTMITRAAELMSDMQLFATVDVSPQLQSDHDDTKPAGGPNSEKTAESTQQHNDPPNRWMVSSHERAQWRASALHAQATKHDHNASTSNNDTSDRSYSHDIRFGLSPNAVFDRAESRGSYREFVHHNDEGIQRGFDFRLDAKRGNNHSSATPSDCNDDDNRGYNHSSATPSDCNDDDHSSNVNDDDYSSNGNSH